MDGMTDDLHGPGWWVGSDGYWHPPDEEFDADVPKRNHPARRVAVVLLAVALVGATTVGAWLGGSSGGVGPVSRVHPWRSSRPRSNTSSSEPVPTSSVSPVSPR